MPETIRGGEIAGIDNPQSPNRHMLPKRRVTYDMWAEDEEWVQFRTVPHPGHVPSNITTLVQLKFLPRSAGKRKRNATDEVDVTTAHENVDGEHAGQTTKVKRSTDNRRWCFRCTYKIRLDNAGRRDKPPKNVSRFDGLKPKKTICFCMRCQVALCQACFRPWHDQVGLPPTPPAPGPV
jgi:hypothetical protein